MSTCSLREYTQVKHVAFDRTGQTRKTWHRTIFTDPQR
jgi:betaine-aldehyde dehydrogenase